MTLAAARPPVEGARQLREWRKGKRLRLREVSDILGNDGVVADVALLSNLERSFRRPGLRLAVALERMSGGAVPIESWDRPSRTGLSDARRGLVVEGEEGFA